jgi:hypothetical protein
MISHQDRTAGLTASLLLVQLCTTPTNRVMLGELIRAGRIADEPVSIFVRGDMLFASVEFAGMAALPVPLRLMARGWG